MNNAARWHGERPRWGAYPRLMNKAPPEWLMCVGEGGDLAASAGIRAVLISRGRGLSRHRGKGRCHSDRTDSRHYGGKRTSELIPLCHRWGSRRSPSRSSRSWTSLDGDHRWHIRVWRWGVDRRYGDALVYDVQSSRPCHDDHGYQIGRKAVADRVITGGTADVKPSDGGSTEDGC